MLSPEAASIKTRSVKSGLALTRKLMRMSDGTSISLSRESRRLPFSPTLEDRLNGVGPWRKPFDEVIATHRALLRGIIFYKGTWTGCGFDIHGCFSRTTVDGTGTRGIDPPPKELFRSGCGLS